MVRNYRLGTCYSGSMFGFSILPGGDGAKAALEKAIEQLKSRTLSPITNAEAPSRPDDSCRLVRPEQES